MNSISWVVLVAREIFMKKSNFSLIELFIVFAILAVLASLLQPALISTHRAAGFMACQNNLKQIGLGHFTYMEDNNGYIHSVDWAGSITSPVYRTTDRTRGWFHQNATATGYLVPYVGEVGSKVYQCPSFEIDINSDFYKIVKNNGFNTYRGFRSVNLPITTLRDFVFPQPNRGRPGPGFVANKTFKPITWDFTSKVTGNRYYDTKDSVIHGNSGDLPVLFSDGHTKTCFFPVSEWGKHNFQYDESYLRDWYD